MTSFSRRSHRTLAAAVLVACAGATVAAVDLSSDTLKAWNAYVAAVEMRIEGELRSREGFLIQDFGPEGRQARQEVLAGNVPVFQMPPARTGDLPGALIQHWRGSIFLAGITRDQLLARLQHPLENGPHQEDVVMLKVLKREPDYLRLFIRMTRTKVVTVAYDTEHEVTYRRHGGTRASSRSVATKIVEIDPEDALHGRTGVAVGDRGFLWRLNSYWRYEQVNGGVIVELESLTLSRNVPFGLGTLAEPIIDRIARESIARTLRNIRSPELSTSAASRGEARPSS